MLSMTTRIIGPDPGHLSPRSWQDGGGLGAAWVPATGGRIILQRPETWGWSLDRSHPTFRRNLNMIYHETVPRRNLPTVCIRKYLSHLTWLAFASPFCSEPTAGQFF